jgi:glucosylceramidase
MTGSTSRRSFLKVSALGLAAGATAPAASAGPTTNSNEDFRDISLWITAGAQRYAAAPPIRWQPMSTRVSAEAVELDPGRTYQDVLGFGAALTDAACYMFNQLREAERQQLFHELFHPSEMGLSVCRTAIGSSDYASKLFSYCDGEADPELARFSITQDREYVLPVLRQARRVNPELFLFSSPWSPPGWMKANGSMLGGSMRKKWFSTYAQYLLKFLQAYAAEGVAIQALTPQNEVDTDQDGRMPACLWGQEYEIEFVREHLGPLLERTHTPTQIWILDHNYNLWGRAICTLDDSRLKKYVSGVAWHGYVGKPEMMREVQAAHPDIAMYWTEGGPDYTDPDYLTDWTKWGSMYADILRNGCRAITGWNLALDQQGRPNIGPFSCGGFVQIHSQTKEIARSGQYWGTAHYSRAIRRGARLFDSRSQALDLNHAAVVNPGGQRVVVLSNAGAARSVELRLGTRGALVPLPEKAVATLVW